MPNENGMEDAENMNSKFMDSKVWMEHSNIKKCEMVALKQ
jgi:hypothetical protein